MQVPERPAWRPGPASGGLRGRLRASRRTAGDRGQALVEFVAVLLPLLRLVVGIVQFGLLFATNVTLTNATREGARAGTIYVYDRTHTKAWNDGHRCADVLAAATDAFGLLAPAAPHFSATTSGGSCSTTSGDTQVNGDLAISYCADVATSSSPCPDTADTTTTCVPDTREGCLMQVSVTYRSDIIVPFLGDILAHDSNGRFVQRVSATMVVN
jgi:Flp pilus assembly protein TadG